jgi:hypothetical protein
MSFEATVLDNMLRDPKGSEGYFELPCGFRWEDEDGVKILKEIQLREMTGNEEDLLSSDIPFGQKMNRLISACTVRLGDIEDPKMITRCVPRLLEGDRLFLFFALRRVSLGDYYPFREKCPSCDKMTLQNYHLGELEKIDMPNPEQHIYEVELPSGNAAHVRCLTGEDEQRRTQLKNRLKPLSLQIFLRLAKFNGEDATVNHVKSMSQRDRAFLRGQFIEIDGGIETRVKLDCDKCGYQFERELDPSHPGFFSPSETLAVLKRRSST